MKLRQVLRWSLKVIPAVAVLLALGAYFTLTEPDPFHFLKKKKTVLAADPERMKVDVKWLSVEQTPRDYAAKESQEAIVAELEKRFRALGFETSRQPFQAKEGSFENVVAIHKAGSAQDRIVIGAHFDAYEDLPGADDNASGVAGLLELGRLISLNPPPTTVELVTYANEEPPFFETLAMGSYIHASKLKKDQVHVRAMVSLEMIGYFTDEKDSQDYPYSVMKWFYPSRGNFITVVGNLANIPLVRRLKSGLSLSSDLPVRSLNAPESFASLDWSDHRSYWQFGFPAVMLTDTSYLRNKEYHTRNDTWDRLDYQRMAKLISALHAALPGL